MSEPKFIYGEEFQPVSNNSVNLGKYWAALREDNVIGIISMRVPNDVDFEAFREKAVACLVMLGDVFLFASRSETQGMVILEAMAAGMPVVAVRSSGIDDIVVNGVNGFKTPPDTARWNEHIQLLMSDPELYWQLSRHARETADRLSSEQFCKHVQRFYTTILADRRSRSSAV